MITSNGSFAGVKMKGGGGLEKRFLFQNLPSLPP